MLIVKRIWTYVTWNLLRKKLISYGYWLLGQTRQFNPRSIILCFSADKSKFTLLLVVVQIYVCQCHLESVKNINCSYFSIVYSSYNAINIGAQARESHVIIFLFWFGWHVSVCSHTFAVWTSIGGSSMFRVNSMLWTASLT